MIPLGIFIALLFFCSLASRRLEQTMLTSPIIFTILGMLMFRAVAGIVQAGGTANIFL